MQVFCVTDAGSDVLIVQEIWELLSWKHWRHYICMHYTVSGNGASISPWTGEGYTACSIHIQWSLFSPQIVLKKCFKFWPLYSHLTGGVRSFLHLLHSSPKTTTEYALQWHKYFLGLMCCIKDREMFSVRWRIWNTTATVCLVRGEKYVSRQNNRWKFSEGVCLSKCLSFK